MLLEDFRELGELFGEGELHGIKRALNGWLCIVLRTNCITYNSFIFNTIADFPQTLWLLQKAPKTKLSFYVQS